jgi:hypothetical protein
VRECDLGYYVVDRSPIHTLSLRIGHTRSIIDCNGGKYNLQHPAIAFLRSKGLSCFHPHSIHSCTIDNQHCHFTGQSVCKWVYYTTYINVQGFTLSNTSLNLSYSLVLEIRFQIDVNDELACWTVISRQPYKDRLAENVKELARNCWLEESRVSPYTRDVLR